MAQDGAAPVALITGASGGLASAAARVLAEEGYRLVLMSRSGAAEIAAQTGGTGVAGSVLDDGDVQRAVRTAIDRHGRLDAAVFSGGRHSAVLDGFDRPAAPPMTKEAFSYDPGYAGSPFDLPWEAWTANYDMMVLAPMRLAKAALPHLIAAPHGAFVAMSGIEAAQPRVPFGLGPHRLALQGFVKVLSDRFGPDGVRFNAVSPGMMESGSEEFHPGWVETVPLGRVGANAEVGRAIAFLLSPAASYITGQCLTVDGGVNRTLGI